jgi:hypothetical protein
MLRAMLRCVLTMAVAGSLTSHSLAGEANLTGREIIDRYLARQTVDSELGFIAMTISRPGQAKKEYRFLAAYRRESDGSKKVLVRMVRPKDVEGVSLLSLQDAKGDDETYVYMPALGESSRLTGDALDKPFLGSDYSYRDLLAEVPAAHRYERLPDTQLRGVDCYQVRALGNEQRTKDRAYAYRELLIDQEKLQLLRVTFHAAGGQLVKTFMPHEYDSPLVKGQTTRPRRAVMAGTSADAWTEFLVVEGRLNQAIPAEIFTTKRLESWKPEEVTAFIFQVGITVIGAPSE